MSSRADRDLLGDILESIRRAGVYLADQSYEQFLVDTKTQDAVIRTLEIVGEATKKQSPALRERHPYVRSLWVFARSGRGYARNVWTFAHSRRELTRNVRVFARSGQGYACNVWAFAGNVRAFTRSVRASAGSGGAFAGGGGA